MTFPSPATLPQLIAHGAEMRQRVVAAQRDGQRVGVVPTMGALHAGHLSLAQAARQECDLVVCTIFVNPTQFAPGEDFERYPRDLDRDLALLATAGCDVVFAPSVDEMYPMGSETSIDVGSVARPLEGAHRPTHFAGVATVVLKLLQLVPADVAYFGQKDYQQTLVIQRMVADLNVPVQINVCPIVRELDGLAMSSRNAYLVPEERQQAAALYASLQLAQSHCAAGEHKASALEQAMRQHLDQAGGIEVDYIAFVREGTVKPVEQITGPTVIALAARVGQTRLIDNLRIG